MRTSRFKARPAAFWLFLVAGVLWAVIVHAEFYRYVDRDGHTVYVDDISKVPEEYRNQMKRYRERYDHLPPDQRRMRLEAERQRSAAKEDADRSAPSPEASGYLETPIVVEGNKILVPVQLGHGGVETEVMLVLDTGASVITLYREVAEQLDVTEVEKAKTRVVGGALIDTDMIVLSHVKVGPVTKTGLRAGIIDHHGERVEYDGQLGMNFLRGLDYSIDFSGQIIRWGKGSTP